MANVSRTLLREEHVGAVDGMEGFSRAERGALSASAVLITVDACADQRRDGDDFAAEAAVAVVRLGGRVVQRAEKKQRQRGCEDDDHGDGREIVTMIAWHDDAIVVLVGDDVFWLVDWLVGWVYIKKYSFCFHVDIFSCCWLLVVGCLVFKYICRKRSDDGNGSALC